MRGSELRNLLHPLLLLLVFERPGHGYDLIERLEALGVTDVDAGHVYRVLRSLERNALVQSGWVPSQAGPARRRYELTAKGHDHLSDWVIRLTQLEDLIQTCLSRMASAPVQLPDAAVTGPTDRRRHR